MTRPATLALLLSCSAVVWAAEPATGDKTVALRAVGLPWDGQALTPGCIKKPESRRDLPSKSMVIAFKSGLVEPGDKSVINKDASITVGGTQVTFSQSGGSVSYALPGGRPMKLKSHGDGFDGIAVPTASRTVIPLAFPIAEIQSSNSNQTSTVRLYYRSALVAAGQLGSDVVYLVDDEIDGICTSGKDAISVNSGVVFAPLGRWLPTSTALYQITEVDKGWAKLVCAPASEPTVRLSVAGPGMQGEIHALFANGEVNAVVTSHKPVTTKAGAYKLTYGLLIDPAKHVTYAGILPGKSTAFDAAAPITLGGPFRLEFTASAVNKQLGIDQNSLRLYGRNEEQYVCFRIGGQPSVGLNGKAVGMMQFDRTRGTLSEFTQPLPNRIPAGEATVTLDLIIEGLGRVQGTAKVSI